MSLILGSHISLNQKSKYLLGVVEETICNGANCFMIFTGPPQNVKRVDTSLFYKEEALELAKQHNIDFSNCVVHAPYVFNLAGLDTDGYIVNILQSEIERTVSLGIKYFVVHPGSFRESKDEGINNIVRNVLEVFRRTSHLDYFFCLETMAGKRNQIGACLEDLQLIFSKCNWDPKLALCLDTCHLHDSGYDLSKLEEFKKKLSNLFGGLERVKVIHLGDSMNPIGAKKDRHANYGLGHIGWETILKWAYDDYFSSLPIIVETPYWKKQVKSKRSKETREILVSPYKHEISLLRNKKWEPIPDKDCLPIYIKE
ncbi:apurinic endonuclease Apn1 [Mycoplasma suis KI3806]|uniref:Probable endonuclease 4 n=1 Tax=Mycoplasma suis (strain KI_3806) TaxID=708248 RepID=F0V2J1_MYCS3|nr:deoxyribonuclease IV [Mycoplasma suis]CBZ40872.1 apurinic endonuclease Apn1 [Mycoplasma suis KI3806]